MTTALYKKEMAAARKRYERDCRDILRLIPSIDAAKKLANIWDGSAVVGLSMVYGTCVDIEIKLSETQTIAKDVFIFLDEIQDLGFETNFTGEDMRADYWVTMRLIHKTLKGVRLCVNTNNSGCKKIQVGVEPVYKWKC